MDYGYEKRRKKEMGLHNDMYNKMRRYFLNKYKLEKIKITDASHELDTKFSTDTLIKMKKGDQIKEFRVADRLRSEVSSTTGKSLLVRDLTIRKEFDGRTNTEINKLFKSNVKWYFCGWHNPVAGIRHWCLVNIDKLDKSGLVDKYRDDLTHEFTNSDDNNKAIWIDVYELEQAGCIDYINFDSKIWKH